MLTWVELHSYRLCWFITLNPTQMHWSVLLLSEKNLISFKYVFCCMYHHTPHNRSFVSTPWTKTKEWKSPFSCASTCGSASLFMRRSSTALRRETSVFTLKWYNFDTTRHLTCIHVFLLTHNSAKHTCPLSAVWEPGSGVWKVGNYRPGGSPQVLWCDWQSET